MSQFAGKVALITGGNAGIGRAAAIEFAKQGAKVVVSGRREKEGHEVIAEIKALGGEAIFVKTDVSKASDVKAMIEQTLAKFGRLDFASVCSIIALTSLALETSVFTKIASPPKALISAMTSWPSFSRDPLTTTF